MLVCVKCFLTIVRRLKYIFRIREIYGECGLFEASLMARFALCLFLVPCVPVSFWTILMSMEVYTWWFWLLLHLVILTGCVLVIRLVLPWGTRDTHDFLAISVLFIVFQALLHNVIYVVLQIVAVWFDSIYILDQYENAVNNSSSLIWGCTLVFSVAWYAAEQQLQRRESRASVPSNRHTYILVAVCVVWLFVFDLMVQLSHLFTHAKVVFGVGLYGSLTLRSLFVAFWLYQERRLTNKLSASLTNNPRHVAHSILQLRQRMGPVRLAAVGQALDILSLVISFPRYDFEIVFIWMIKLMGQAFTSLGVIAVLDAKPLASTRSYEALTEPLLHDQPVTPHPPKSNKKMASWAPNQPVQNAQPSTPPGSRELVDPSLQTRPNKESSRTNRSSRSSRVRSREDDKGTSPSTLQGQLVENERVLSDPRMLDKHFSPSFKHIHTPQVMAHGKAEQYGDNNKYPHMPYDLNLGNKQRGSGNMTGSCELPAQAEAGGCAADARLGVAQQTQGNTPCSEPASLALIAQLDLEANDHEWDPVL
eukprot:g47753.t1